MLLRYTLYGDATMDGVVDFNDLVKLAQNYNTASGKNWIDGDFTYDGAVDFNDLVKLAQNYNTALPAEQFPVQRPIFRRRGAAALASVPEPSIALNGAAGAIVFCFVKVRNAQNVLPCPNFQQNKPMVQTLSSFPH